MYIHTLFCDFLMHICMEQKPDEGGGGVKFKTSYSFPLLFPLKLWGRIGIENKGGFNAIKRASFKISCRFYSAVIFICSCFVFYTSKFHLQFQNDITRDMLRTLCAIIIAINRSNLYNLHTVGEVIEWADK